MPPTPIVDPAVILAQPLANEETLAELRSAMGAPELFAMLAALVPDLEAQATALAGLQEAEALSAAAHSLKGLAASLGATRLSLLAAAIETPLRAGAAAEAVSALLPHLVPVAADSRAALLAHGAPAGS